MSEHEVVYGCLYELEIGAICHCGNDPTSIANDKLADLRTAGNAMAEQWKAWVEVYGDEDGSTAALAAWEKVAK